MSKLDGLIDDIKKHYASLNYHDGFFADIIGTLEELAPRTITLKEQRDKEIVLTAAKNIQTQDTGGTNFPLYCVYRTREIVLQLPEASIPGTVSQRKVYIDVEYNSVVEEKNVEKYCIEHGMLKENLQIGTCIELAELVTACITHGDAENFIFIQRHNLKNPFIKIETMGGCVDTASLYHSLKQLQLEQ